MGNEHPTQKPVRLFEIPMEQHAKPGEIVQESFFHTVKTELVHHEHYRTREEARASVFEYIEAFYNRTRIHSTLDYCSPAEFELKNVA